MEQITHTNTSCSDTRGSVIAPVDSPYLNSQSAPSSFIIPTKEEFLKKEDNLLILKAAGTKDENKGLPAILKSGEIECPFQLFGCEKTGTQKEIQLHIRDNRDFHGIQMTSQLKNLGKNMQDTYKYIADYMVGFWLGLDRAEVTTRKFGPQQMTFKISDISKEMYKSHLEKGKSNLLYSDMFETHRFGYRMVAIVDPFGDGPARTEFISVFVSLVKGDYDAIQEWPFRLPVTFSIRKPGSRSTYQKTFCPDADKNPEKFSRPESGRNRAFGFQFFYPIADLDQCSRADDIFIDIFIDVTKLYDFRQERYSVEAH